MSKLCWQYSLQRLLSTGFKSAALDIHSSPTSGSLGSSEIFPSHAFFQIVSSKTVLKCYFLFFFFHKPPCPPDLKSCFLPFWSQAEFARRVFLVLDLFSSFSLLDWMPMKAASFLSSRMAPPPLLAHHALQLPCFCSIPVNVAFYSAHARRNLSVSRHEIFT